MFYTEYFGKRELSMLWTLYNSLLISLEGATTDDVLILSNW